MRRLMGLVLSLALLVFSGMACAHKPSDSYLTLDQPAQGQVLDIQWDIALRDLQQAIGLDRNSDGQITWGELRAEQNAVSQYAFSRLKIEAGHKALCPFQFSQLLFDEHVDGGYAVLRFQAQCPVRPARISVHYGLLFDIDPNHRGLLQVRAGEARESRVLAAENPAVALDLGNTHPGQQLRAFFAEGIWHILNGYDHILFLLTLLLPAVVIRRNGKWEPRASIREAFVDVLKVVTAFTAAHSITLSLAVNGFISLPSRWVESAIAVTVLLGALNNIFPFVYRRRWAVAFAFGLIHGLGFASVLADLGVHGMNLGLALLGFNLGVEAGQLALVMLLVPIAFWLRESRAYRQLFMPGGAAAISCLAVYWLAVRLWGFTIL